MPYPHPMTLAVPHRRGLALAVACALVTVLAAIVLGMWRPWAPLPAADPIGAGEQMIVAERAPLSLPEHPTVLVFGDSWTYGSAADSPTLGYAYLLADLLDGDTIVDGVRGSGYLKPGIDGPAYGERIAALDAAPDVSLDAALAPDLVIVQGSINDRAQGEEGYREAVNAAWDALAATYADAAIVVLGPAPHILPVEPGTARIDRDLSSLAAARGWWYISPVAEQWITEENYLDVIDVDPGNRHPSTDGHRYLAEKVAAALAELSAAPVTEAGETEPSSTAD